MNDTFFKEDGCTHYKIYAISFFIALSFMMLLFGMFQYAPFGNNSLACMDAHWQYLDFFAYLKDVIQGNNSVFYSLTNTLGGTGLGVYSYYLASPLNLLVVFFEKKELHSFFDLLVALKIALAAASMAFFLENRFTLHSHILLCLSLAYAFSQYNIAQSSNVMWLDGVYLLPLILLGVYRCIREDKISLLSVTVALSILFNWYSAGINCMFSVIWFFIEIFLNQDALTIRVFIKKALRYSYAMLTGVLLSAVLFLPSVALLREGAGSGFDWNLFSFKFKGNILSVIKNFVVGSTSKPGGVSLYCGSVALIGALCIFGKQNLEKKHWNVLRVLLLITVLLFYWQPLIFSFSLFKSVGSYWFRYSYTGIFTLIFIAAYFYQTADGSVFFPKKSRFFLSLFVCIFVLVNLILPDNNKQLIFHVVATVVFLGVFFVTLSKASNASETKHMKWFSMALVLLTLFELGFNTKLLMARYHSHDIEKFKNYEMNTEAQIDGIKNLDKGSYRISQTSARNKYPNGLTASYNESIAFNYPSITSYTSCPDNRQLKFLEHLGYRTETNQKIKIVNTSILGADSLLGVKYILSDYPVRGLKALNQLKKGGTKKIYLNEFAFPLAFVVNGNSKDNYNNNNVEKLNPFEYQNRLFTTIYGSEANIYKPIKYLRKLQGKDVEYTVLVPQGNYGLYGNLPWRKDMDAVVYKNKTKLTSYSRWLSPSVFYIPSDQKERTVNIKLKTKNGVNIKEEQFYALDLDLLKHVSRVVSSRQVTDLKIDRTTISCTTDGKEGDRLFLSVPYHKGWTVTINGKVVLPELLGNCLMVLPLEKGANRIQMHYRVPYIVEGCILTLLGFACLLGYSKIFNVSATV